MADGWDLHAVVSGCTTAASTSATINVNGQTNNVEDPLPDLASLTFTNDDDTLFYNPGFGDSSDFECEGLEEIYRSFNFLKPRPNNPCTSSIPPTQQEAQSLPSPPPPQTMVQVQQLITPQLIKNSRAGSSLPLPATVRSRRRKNQQTKLVRQMSHEELLGDSWAWRKYGQKPIKGSPYPRNYYRCSTSKGCGARKQVEKSPADPDIYVVSYSGEHTHPRPTHRNSLAGTTRAKFSSRPTAAGASSEPPSAAGTVANPPCSSSSPVSASSLSPSTPLIEGESSAAPPENSLTETIEILDDEEDDEMGETECDEVVLIPNTVMSEDILKGFEELRRANSGSTRFQTRDNSLSPWNFSAAAAGDGGGC
ncbi:hypothetical protein RHSIM_Rhsim03G0192300 [Rhododendron simsii]|uniref:WRKY domain-containing protein n=1 Tax=Rhododendron simsii TaxID=118357 RepID=A0A834H5H7_RHOSS|nr:hypothetical protein RHSIM_Rhsim03G0192300 [Rhododendron simsii]